MYRTVDCAEAGLHLLQMWLAQAVFHYDIVARVKVIVILDISTRKSKVQRLLLLGTK